MRSRSFIVLWIAMLVAMAGIGMVSPLLPVYVREDLGGPEIAVALSFSGLGISQIIAAPFVGRLGDRFGVKSFIVGGFLLYAIGALGYRLTESWELVIFFRVLSGFGAAAIFPLALAYIGRIAPEGREGSYIGVFAVAEVTGFGLGPLIGGAIRDAVDADAAFVTMAAMLAVTGLATFLLLPSERRERAGDPSTNDRAEGGASALPRRRLVRRLDVQAGILASIVISLGWGTAGTYMAVFVVSDDGLGTDSALFVGLLLGVRSLLGAVFQPLAGFAADRVSRIWLVVGGLSVAAVAQFVIPDLPRDLVDSSFFGGSMTYAPWLLAIIVIVGIDDRVPEHGATAAAGRDRRLRAAGQRDQPDLVRSAVDRGRGGADDRRVARVDRARTDVPAQCAATRRRRGHVQPRTGAVPAGTRANTVRGRRDRGPAAESWRRRWCGCCWG